ncbi:hypothetical protein BGX34_003193, partial [Mortierella sp. NVP85]
DDMLDEVPSFGEIEAAFADDKDLEPVMDADAAASMATGQPKESSSLVGQDGSERQVQPLPAAVQEGLVTT